MITVKTQSNKIVPISKKVFVKAINAMKEYNRKIDAIQTVLEENCEEASFWPPSLWGDLVNVLKDAFNDNDDYGGMIEYFIYDLEFGKQWEPGVVTDENNKDIKMQTPEELYDYLVDRLE